ncbi:MAG: 4-hydroxythreonine-4-phosphate dehydrogenase PdxA [Acidobacteriota bacterium]|nr:4-hydroxythreonine-4-phosphate dehydrogenase PdxA [Acidobacteriota bacterium]
MRPTGSQNPTLIFTQGDPAGVGPEILLRLLADSTRDYRAVVVAERAALERHAAVLAQPLPNFVELETGEVAQDDSALALVDPVGVQREVTPGAPGAADAHGAVAALDVAIELMRSGAGDALVTCPLAKGPIAEHERPGFVGHTDYLAAAAGMGDYGRDYLMTFLSADLRVALLNTHMPLRAALDAITPSRIVDALACLDRHAGGCIGVAGLNPHAGEGGLLGTEDDEVVRPAVEQARRLGIDASGPMSADSIFARARRGEYDWVLALYHDQGLIAVKTAAFGSATNWTLGLPWIRTSVDHGTAYDIAGTASADVEPLVEVVRTTLDLIAGRR